jgi:hypothetical protein
MRVWSSMTSVRVISVCLGTVCNPIPKISKMQCVSTIHHSQTRMRSPNQRRSETKRPTSIQASELMCAFNSILYWYIQLCAFHALVQLWESQIGLGLCFIWLLQSLVLNRKGTGGSFSYTVSWRDVFSLGFGQRTRIFYGRIILIIGFFDGWKKGYIITNINSYYIMDVIFIIIKIALTFYKRK